MSNKKGINITKRITYAKIPLTPNKKPAVMILITDVIRAIIVKKYAWREMFNMGQVNLSISYLYNVIIIEEDTIY